MARLVAMFEGAATYTFPWLLEGDTERFLNELDGVPLFAGAEYARPCSRSTATRSSRTCIRRRPAFS